MQPIKALQRFFAVKKAANRNILNISHYPTIGTIPANFPQANTFQNDLELIKAFYLCPPLNWTIGHRALSMSKVKYKMFRVKNGEMVEVKEHPILSLLKEPNDTQSWHEFIKHFWGYYDILGNSYINFYVPEGFSQPTKMFVCPAQNMRIYLKNENILNADFRNNEITNYAMQIGGKYYYIQPDHIMHKREANYDYFSVAKSYLFGRSVAVSLEKPINSIVKSLGIEEYLLEQSTALGILTGRGSGDVMNAPTPDQIKDTQEKFNNKYGLTAEKWKFIITGYPLEFKPINLPIRDLMLTEGQLKNADMIYNAYHTPSIIFNNDSATFANKAEANRQLWENVLIPMVDDFFNDLTNSLKQFFKEDFVLLPDYSSIPELKENLEKKFERLSKAFDRGAISRGRLALELGEPATPDMMNEYYIASNLVKI